MTNGTITRRDLLGAGAAAGIGALASKRSTFAAPALLQGEPVTLRFMTHNTLEQPAGDVLKEIIAEFEEQNPDIKIQLEEVPNADILTKLTAYAEGDDLPDLLRAFAQSLNSFGRFLYLLSDTSHRLDIVRGGLCAGACLIERIGRDL